MIIVKLKGGFCNNLFQYAAAKALSIKRYTPLLLDLSFLEQSAAKPPDDFTARQYELGIFKNIKQEFVTDQIRELFSTASRKQLWLKRFGLSYPTIYHESSFEFNGDFFLQKPTVLLDGYWQTERYFLHEADEIIKAFTFPALVASDENNNLLGEIKNSLAVSVHVRRADYLQPAIAALHGTCSVDYYNAGIRYFQSLFPSAIFYFFSDDAAWVKDNFTDQLPGSVLVKNNQGADSWKDIYLMSSCHHHIIANSSFSWWGAWLNPDQDKIVVAPSKWFCNTDRTYKDVIPAAWIQL